MTDKEKQELDEGAFNAAVSLTERPSYAGTFDQQLADIYDRIANREKFSYDVNADPLYQAAKDQKIQQGKLAMKDTMGQAAALTGGYGSTYGQQVGQQTYDAYLQSLSDAIPELYGMAYQKYQNEGDDLLTRASLIGNQRDTEYKRYRDELGDWESERAWGKQLETEQYNRQQQSYANLYALIRASGYSPTDAELAAAGMTREAANALQKEYTRSITPTATSSGSSGGSSGGGGRSGGSSGGGYSGLAPDGRDAATVQRELNAMGAGLAVDGIWGPRSQAAWEKYYGGGGSGAAAGAAAGVGGWGFQDVAGVYDNARSNGVSPTQVNQYLQQEVQAGTISREDADYIRKNWKTKDRL